AVRTLAPVAPSLVMRPIAQGQLRSRRSRPSTDTMRWFTLMNVSTVWCPGVRTLAKGESRDMITLLSMCGASMV
ncbi:hypothetical protein L873DRAFT_1680579, partial [Choiromyces venosus 120613-1]